MPPSAKVKGSISFNGRPLPAGEIHFGMVGVPPSVLPIKDGTFSGEAPVGKNQVEVYVYVEGPPSEKYRGVRPKHNVMPEKYWGAATILEASVAASGTNEFKFELTSE